MTVRFLSPISASADTVENMSIDEEILHDLRDVFASLYDDEDWLPSDDDEAGIHLHTPREPTPEPHPDLTEIVPSEEELRAKIEIQLAEESSSESRDQRFSSKRLREAVDSLLGTRNAVAGPSKRRKVAPVVAPSSASVSPYHPQALLARLRTFRPASYTPKPACLSEVEAARCGWMNDGVESLKCAKGCGSWWTVGRIREHETVLARKMAKMLIEAHKSDCPWRVRQTPVSQLSYLRQQMHPPLSTALEPIARSIDATCSASGVPLSITSPLPSQQLTNLTNHLNSHAPTSTPLSTAASAAALFGWSPSPFDSQILECRICLRRLGLWSSKETLDVVQEHLAWCPIGAKTEEKGTEWWNSAVVLSFSPPFTSTGAGVGAERTKKSRGLGSLGVLKPNQRKAAVTIAIVT